MATDDTKTSDYGDPMSERMLGIAADVLRSFGSAFGGQHLAIIGGAVPSLLMATPPPGMELSSAGGLVFEFPVAGLASWLSLKSDALMRRNKPKDAYDIVWTLDALGPDVASELVTASPLMEGPLAEEVEAQMRRLASDQFRDIDSVGPNQYATFVNADPGDRERRHAHGTLAAFARALAERNVG